LDDRRGPVRLGKEPAAFGQFGRVWKHKPGTDAPNTRARYKAPQDRTRKDESGSPEGRAKTVTIGNLDTRVRPNLSFVIDR
jgi:hypothetical protein